jgi:exopolysaccharide biosynthesis polyprenyl glycosylphosphotransferase
MIRRFSVNFAIFSIFVDVFTVFAILWLNVSIRPFIDEFLPVKPVPLGAFNLPVVLYIVFPLAWVAIMASFSVYDGSKNLRVVDEFTSLTLSSMLAGIALAGILYLTYRDISRAMFLIFGLMTYLVLLSWRIIARSFYRQRNQAAERVRHVLIVGAGPVGIEVAKSLCRQEWQEHGVKWIGFLDDDPKKQPPAREDVLGPLNTVRQVVLEKHIDDVVFALPLRAHSRLNELTKALQDLPVHTWIVPDYFQLALHQARLTDFAGIPMLDLRAPALSEYQRQIKRLFDLIVTSLLLIPALPLMGVLALVIWAIDGRPVLFKQKRVGENGHLFTLYKFRTMLPNAEKMFRNAVVINAQENTLHKHPDDPRITPLGRFLRRFSMDELPQLFNILGGSMSLVGPRPELPELVAKYQPWQRARFAIPQGLTGWWQIHGRSDKPMHLHTEDDLYYVQNYSFWLDIQILILTFWIVMRGKGAY